MSQLLCDRARHGYQDRQAYAVCVLSLGALVLFCEKQLGKGV